MTYEVTQRSIQDWIMNLFKDEAWGDPKDYDLIITREWKDFDTKYSVMPRPKAWITEEMWIAYEETDIKLQDLYSDNDITVENDEPF